MSRFPTCNADVKMSTTPQATRDAAHIVEQRLHTFTSLDDAFVAQWCNRMAADMLTSLQRAITTPTFERQFLRILARRIGDCARPLQRLVDDSGLLDFAAKFKRTTSDAFQISFDFQPSSESWTAPLSQIGPLFDGQVQQAALAYAAAAGHRRCLRFHARHGTAEVDVHFKTVRRTMLVTTSQMLLLCELNDCDSVVVGSDVVDIAALLRHNVLAVDGEDRVRLADDFKSDHDGVIDCRPTTVDHKLNWGAVLKRTYRCIKDRRRVTTSVVYGVCAPAPNWLIEFSLAFLVRNEYIAKVSPDTWVWCCT
jgi:hypothetical protein